MKSEQPITQDEVYRQTVDLFGRNIARFVAGYERDPGKRQELLQEVHLALWQSLAGFKGQCSLRSWAYRVAHNVGVRHVQRSLRSVEQHGMSLDDVESHVDERGDIAVTDRRLDFQRVMAVVHSLKPVDREVMLLYLEDLDATTIGDIIGLSAPNVATKVHRIKSVLAGRLGVRSSKA